MTQPTIEQIGRYKILGEIGRGAMGVVYRAQDPAIGRIVAIKTIRLGELVDASERAKLHDRLIREAQSAGILSHPGIVTIYDVAEEGDLNYISMEYVDGSTLERMVALDPPDGRLVLDILAQTAAALDYAHKRGIVHRDIKPANIMMHERSTAKITDFGVARIQSHQMTQAGSMVGTPNYMSPEQIQGLPVDGRSDQFSLAVIAYELLTGEKPFAADSIPALAFKIVQDDPPPVHRLNPTLDWPVDTVLKRALSKAPTDRYPTCSDFAFAVENACRSSKGWKPIAAGALQSMPTLSGRTVAASPAAPPPRSFPSPAMPVEPAPEAEDASEAPPRLLQWARKLAVAAVALAVLGAVLMGALQLFDNDLPDPEKEVAGSDTPAQALKPSPAGSDLAAPSEVEDQTAEPPGSADGRAAPQGSAGDESPAPPATERTKTASQGSAAPRFISNPPGARVEVDNNPDHVCTAPCSIELPRGRHTIAATMEGYRRTLKIFETPTDSEIFLNLDPTTGTLMIRSEPRGAAIFVDGQARNETTPALLTLPTGRHTIEVVQDSRRQKHEVTIREALITNLAVELQ